MFWKSIELSWVEASRLTAVSVAAEEPHGNQRVEEVTHAARMQTKLTSQLGAREAAIAEPCEETELDRGEQYFGRPETESRLQNWTGIELSDRRRHGCT